MHEINLRLNSEFANQPYIKDVVKIKHSINPGDAVASMAAVKKFWEVTGRKAMWCQKIGQEAQYYTGAVHPTVDDKTGTNVCMNNRMFEMMKPLMESQAYVDSVEKYEGQEINLDFDTIRGKTFVNLPHGSIQAWVMYAFPDLAYDLSTPWIELDDNCPPHILEQVQGKIIVNFTERYRNTLMDYYFLKNYEFDLVFAGTEREHWLFTSKWNLNIPYLKVDDFLEYAYAIKNSRFILCNQSIGWQIAEAMKHPRILEICQYAQNCLPFYGEHSYGYFHQVGLEYYVKKLSNIRK